MPNDPHDISGILAAINALPDANSGDPVADLFTWEDSDVTSHPAANIPMPGEPVTSPSQVSTPTQKLPAGVKSVGGSTSVSRSGMTEGGLRKAGGLFGQADANTAAFSRADEDYTQGQIDQSRAGFAGVGSAMEGEIDVTRQFQEEENRLRQDEQDFYKGAAELEQRLAGEAQAERASYISAYKEQLAVVQQLALQSGNPMTKLSGGEALGLAGAQFAQGFLAAQGIQIDVSGQVDRWVDRSIQEHQMKIANARDVANDQLHLYEIARQNSQDDWESRQRYRGFVIAGLQSAIGLNASRFQSGIAMARAQENIARLQVEADATERAIGDAHFTRVQQYQAQQFDRAFKTGSLAREDARIALARRQQDWEESPNNPKNKPKPGEGPPPQFVIGDPEGLKNPDGTPMVDDRGNVIQVNRWRMRADVASDPVLARKRYEEGVDAKDNYQQYLVASNKLMATYADAKKVKDDMGILGDVSWDAAARMDKTGKVQEFLQARDAFTMAKVYNDSGKAATDVEYKRQLAQVYTDKFLAANGNKGEKSIAQLREDGRTKFQSRMSEGWEEIPEGDREQIKREVTASPRTQAENQAILHGTTAVPGFAATEMSHVTERGSEKVETKKISGAWADFQRKQLSDDPSTKIKLGQPEFAVAIDHLAAAVARPNYIARTSSGRGVAADKIETPEEVRREAYDAINRLARGDAQSTPPEAMSYALHVLNGIDSDPVLSKALEHEDDVSESPFIERLTWRPGK